MTYKFHCQLHHYWTGDRAHAETTQDAGVKEHILDSVPDVISVAEEPLSSKLYDSSVDHKEILKQPLKEESKKDSATPLGTAQDSAKAEETSSDILNITAADHLPDVLESSKSVEHPDFKVTPDSTSVPENLERKYSSQDSGLSEKVFESIPSKEVESDSQTESGQIENETQIVENPKTIDIPIGSPQAEVTETETQPGNYVIEGHTGESITDHPVETLDEPLPSSDKSNKEETVTLDQDVSGSVKIVLPRSPLAQEDAEEHHKLTDDSIAKQGVHMETLSDSNVLDKGTVAGVDSDTSLLSSVTDIGSVHVRDSVNVSQKEEFLKKTTVQDAGLTEKTVTSIPDEELLLEEPLVPDLKNTDIHRNDIQITLPIKSLKTTTEVTQDAGVKEHVVDSIPDVISEAEEPSSSTLDSSVAHREILIQSFPGISKIDSEAAPDEESQIKKTTVQDAGISEKTIASIPDEELLLEEPLVTDLKSTDIIHHGVQVSLPIGPILTDDGTNAKATQDAGVKEHVVDSIPDVISEAEEPLSLPLGLPVDHQVIVNPPFTETSLKVKKSEQDAAEDDSVSRLGKQLPDVLESTQISNVRQPDSIATTTESLDSIVSEKVIDSISLELSDEDSQSTQLIETRESNVTISPVDSDVRLSKEASVREDIKESFNLDVVQKVSHSDHTTDSVSETAQDSRMSTSPKLKSKPEEEAGSNEFSEEWSTTKKIRFESQTTERSTKETAVSEKSIDSSDLDVSFEQGLIDPTKGFSLKTIHGSQHDDRTSGFHEEQTGSEEFSEEWSTTERKTFESRTTESSTKKTSVFEKTTIHSDISSEQDLSKYSTKSSATEFKAKLGHPLQSETGEEHLGSEEFGEEWSKTERTSFEIRSAGGITQETLISGRSTDVSGVDQESSLTSEETSSTDVKTISSGEDKKSKSSEDYFESSEEWCVIHHKKQSLDVAGKKMKTRQVMNRTVGPDGEIMEQITMEEYESDNSESSSRRSSIDSSVYASGEVQVINPDHEFSTITVYTDTVEEEPQYETEMNEYEDVLPDGTIVRRKVTKTKKKQTVIKRVILEEFEEDQPFSDLSSCNLVPQLQPGQQLFTRYSDHSCTDPEISTDIQLSEETLPDGTMVRKRITNTKEQQLTTERLVVCGTGLFDYKEGEEDEVFDNLRKLGSPRILPGNFFEMFSNISQGFIML